MSQLPPQSVFFGLAILASLAAVLANSRRTTLDAATVFGLFSLAAIAAVVGARILWVFVSPEAGFAAAVARPAIVWHPLRGGFASLGGWAGAAVVLGLATRGWTRGERWKLADTIVPPALIGMALARLGCLSNGCDYGVVQSWGIRYASDMPAYHEHIERGLLAVEASRSLPTFPLPPVLSAATFVIALVALVVAGRLADGKTAVLSCAGYFAARLVLEFFRAPSTVEMVAGPVNVNHLLALLGLGATLAAWGLYRPDDTIFDVRALEP